jgi:hypothetical protein
MLAHRADTRIWQSLDISDRPTKDQLEARLTRARAHNRHAQNTSKDRAHDLILDLIEETIILTEIDLIVRMIEDVEVELIAFAHQIELEQKREIHNTRAVARLSLFVGDRCFELEQLHGRLAYKMRASATLLSYHFAMIAETTLN